MTTTSAPPQNYTPNSAVIRSEPQKIFVYGTLKKGHPNHDRYLKDAKLLGQAQIEGIMFHIGGYPAINLSERFSKIIGEVYQVDWESILSIDELEGTSYGHYMRVEISAFPYNKVWTYVYSTTRASTEQYIIPSGMWRGRDTPKVAWGGWGRGALIGQFSTEDGGRGIRIGSKNSGDKSEFMLRKNITGNTYDLVRIKTNEVMGSYQYLGEMTKEDGISKPILRLPSKSQPSTENSIEDAVVTTIKASVLEKAAKDASNYSPAPRTTPAVPYVSKEPLSLPPPRITREESQEERLLGIKVREA